MGIIAINNLYIAKMPKNCKECPLTYLDTGDDAYFGANERRCVIDDSCIDGMVSERAYDCPLVEAIPKDQYEARLKADMMAMLEELKTEINIMSDTVVEGRTVTITSCKGMQKRICDLVQSRIDKLKENMG